VVGAGRCRGRRERCEVEAPRRERSDRGPVALDARDQLLRIGELVREDETAEEEA